MYCTYKYMMIVLTHNTFYYCTCTCTGLILLGLSLMFVKYTLNHWWVDSYQLVRREEVNTCCLCYCLLFSCCCCCLL